VLIGALLVSVGGIGSASAEQVLRPKCNVRVETFEAPKESRVPIGTLTYKCPDHRSEIVGRLVVEGHHKLVGEYGDWYEYESRGGFRYLPKAGVTIRTATAAASVPPVGSDESSTTETSKALASGLLPIPPLPEADVAGVRLGGSLDEAKEAMLRANPALTFTPVKREPDGNGREGDTADYYGIVASTKSGDDRFTVFVDHNDRVWRVARTKRFKEGPRLLVAEFKEAARKKYGTPSSEREGGLSWLFDASGALANPHPQTDPCLGFMTNPWLVEIAPHQIVSIGVFSGMPPTCARIIGAGISGVRDGMGDNYYVGIIDGIAGLNFSTYERQRRSKEREKRIEEEKAKAEGRKIEL
jgi:hypothetical protein